MLVIKPREAYFILDLDADHLFWWTQIPEVLIQSDGIVATVVTI